MTLRSLMIYLIPFPENFIFETRHIQINDKNDCQKTAVRTNILSA